MYFFVPCTRVHVQYPKDLRPVLVVFMMGTHYAIIPHTVPAWIMGVKTLPIFHGMTAVVGKFHSGVSGINAKIQYGTPTRASCRQLRDCMKITYMYSVGQNFRFNSCGCGTVQMQQPSHATVSQHSSQFTQAIFQRAPCLCLCHLESTLANLRSPNPTFGLFDFIFMGSTQPRLL